jgi:hypothetical protein
MEPGQITREWLKALDPAEFLEIASMISDIRRERAEARQRERDRRREAAGERPGNRRYLKLERVKCGKKGCKKCASGELHGPYWYLYRPKKDTLGRTSEYIGKVLTLQVAEEFGIPEDQRRAE